MPSTTVDEQPFRVIAAAAQEFHAISRQSHAKVHFAAEDADIFAADEEPTSETSSSLPASDDVKSHVHFAAEDVATKDIYAADEEPESESPSSPSVSDDVRSHPLFQDLMFTACMLEDAKADLVMLEDEIRDAADDHATDEASAQSSPAFQ